MGYKQSQSPALIVIVAAFLVSTPLVYGQLLPYNAINVTGRICCASSGNCLSLIPGSGGIPGVRATLNCTTFFDSVVTVAQGVTDPTGAFSIPFNNIISPIVIDPLIYGPMRCAVVVRLPLNSTVCPILSPVNGVLVGIPTRPDPFRIPVPGHGRNLTVPFFIRVAV